jgi:hypothetical protein
MVIKLSQVVMWFGSDIILKLGNLNCEALNFEAEKSVLFDFRLMHFTLELLLSASQASSILLGD